MKTIKTYEGFMDFFKKKKVKPNIIKEFSKEDIEMLLQELKDDYDIVYEIFEVSLVQEFTMPYFKCYKETHESNSKNIFCLKHNPNSYLIKINSEIIHSELRYSNLKTYHDLRDAITNFIESKAEVFKMDNIKVIKPSREVLEDKFGNTYLDLTTDFILQLND